MTPGSLKAYNTAVLWAMAAANALVFWSLILASARLTERFLSAHGMISWSHVLVAGIAPLVVAVLNGLLPTRLKEVFVFWRISHALPGNRAFSELAPRDSRVSVDRLRARHGALPEDPLAQNQLWYRIYKTHASKPGIMNSHRTYLLTRDATGISVLALALLGTTSLFVGGLSVRLHLIYVCTLGLQYLLLSVSARNYERRFVVNVLAEESATG